MAEPTEVPSPSTQERLDDAARKALSQRIDALLEGQLARVRTRFAWHGLASTLLLPTAIALGAFALDHVLRLPAPIRVFHTLAALAAFGFAGWRFLVYPATRRFSATDAAVMLERAFPQLHERLVSAVQLKRDLEQDGGAALRNQSPAMIEQVLADAAREAQQLPLDQLFVPTRTRRLWAAASCALAIVFGAAIAAPDTAAAFVWRHLGFDVSYPRETQLVVELPPAGADLQRQDQDGATTLVLPAGADLPVSVLAEGVVPAEVFLDVTTSAGALRSIATAQRPGSRFRHVFRRVTSGFTFHARGGDDDRGDREVTVVTIHPPLVADVKAALTPPAYTKKALEVQSGGAIEALIGTQAKVSVRATTKVTSASLVFLESNKRVPLTAEEIVDDAGAATWLIGSFTVEQSDRYTVEMIGDGGLKNPNPGAYSISALQDYAPVGRWLSPDDESNTLLLPEAILCVRAEAKDDFGLLQGTLQIDAGQGRVTQKDLLATATSDAAQRNERVVMHLVELKELLPQQGASDGLALQIDLVDNKEPTPNTTQLPRRQVQIVDQAQLSAAIGRHFRSLREEAEQALDLQNDRRARLTDLMATSPRPSAATAQEITAIEVGQGRIQTASERMLRGAMRAFDMHLWNRLDPSPALPAVVAFYEQWHKEHAEPEPFSPAFYRDLAKARQAGSIGALEQSLDPILRMTLLADSLASELSPPLLRKLAEAQVAASMESMQQGLQQALAMQDKVIASLQEMLSKLDEWNDYQDLVQEARSLIEKQRDVQSRTQQTQGSK